MIEAPPVLDDPDAPTAPEGLTLEELMAMPDELLADLPEDVQQQLSDILASAQEEADARQARVIGLGQALQGEFDRRVSTRIELETRWHSDLRRYNGQYDASVLAPLQNRKFGSSMFVPLTRRLCNIVEARLGDLLFPTEDRNYDIQASPVPELDDAHAAAQGLPPGHMVQGAGPGGAPLQASAVAMGIRELREEAKAKATNMLREVEDQLKEANYPTVARRMLHDGIVIGTGVLKGPMVLNRVKKSWKVLDGVATLNPTEDLSPTVVQVNPWDFYPEMAARTMGESVSEYERHWLNAFDLAKLAKQPGFDADAIRTILGNKAPAVMDNNRNALREASGTQGVTDARYEIIEYHGPIEREDLEACGVKCGDDPLDIYEGVVWFSKTGIVIKAIINPMGTGERPYRVWNWQRDSGSIFGFGLPYEVTDLQDTANSTFRAAMDNLGLSVGGQTVVNTKMISPSNGHMGIEPNKLWEALEKGTDVTKAFAFFEFPSHVEQILAVFNGAKALLDEIAGSQMAMQGQEGTLSPRTDYQASVAYNASNIWMRRAVKNYDDDVTTPLITGFVDWNMQHNPKASIKGDLGVLARGTSALLEAEGQVQRINMFMAQAKDIPMPFARKVAQLREMGKAMRLDTVDILPDDAETKAMAEKIDNAPPPPNPELERIKLRQEEIKDKDADRQFQHGIETMRGRLRMAEIASREGITREEAEKKYGIQMATLEATLADKAAGREHDAQKFNAELVVKQRQGSGI